MKLLFYYSLLFGGFLSGCTGKKTTANTETTSTNIVAKQTLPDSIDKAIGLLDRRLDIKMKRKVYEPQSGNVVTIQKWFENGDTTRLVKLREEVLTGDQKMKVIQFHFLTHTLAEIHDYQYDKHCNEGKQQCMKEAKYFFKNGAFFSAIRREAVGTSTSVPVIEGADFHPFQPAKSVFALQMDRLERIMDKYQTLPFPKPRPEQGTAVH